MSSQQIEIGKVLKYMPWILMVLGMYFMGVVGVILGYIGGVLLQKYWQYSYSEKFIRSEVGEYGVSLIVFAAAIIRADRKIYNAELKYVRLFLSEQYGDEIGLAGYRLLGIILKKPINLDKACKKIVATASKPEKTNVLYFLFKLAMRDRNINAKELNVIWSISNGLGISSNEYHSIKSMFTKDKEKQSGRTNSSYQSKNYNQSQSKSNYKGRKARASYVYDAYGVLGIKKNASIDEIKDAFRKLAIKNHPDKVAHLGELHRKVAKEKFQKINSAYQYLKQKRGFK